MPVLANKQNILYNQSSNVDEWRRPEDWLPMPTGITSADQTFVGLHAVFPEGQNYCAFLFTTSTGQYQVDWGDGTTTLHNSNTIAQYEYNYATYDVGNTTLSSRGYKQAIITVTPVSGNLLTCNFSVRYVTSPIQNQAYSTGFLDCILSMPNANSGGSIIWGSFANVFHRYVERFDIKTIGNSNNLSYFFQDCISLQVISLFDTSNVISMIAMFRGCLSLKTIPLFNTQNVTIFTQTFSICNSLQSVPLLNTSKATLFNSMFDDCTSLQLLPLFNTSNVTNFDRFLRGCSSIKNIPALSTASITTTTGTDFGANFAINCVSLNRCQMIFARTVSLLNCQLSQSGLVEIFTNLVDRTGTTSATITITGNWGASALTAGEREIATNKNWVIVG